MKTKDEIIAQMMQAVEMSKNKFKTCVDHELAEDEFTAYMFGWMQATLEIAITDLKQLN